MFNTYQILYIPAGETIPRFFTKKDRAQAMVEHLVRLFNNLGHGIAIAEFEIITIPWGYFKLFFNTKERRKEQAWDLWEYETTYESFNRILGN